MEESVIRQPRLGATGGAVFCLALLIGALLFGQGTAEAGDVLQGVYWTNFTDSEINFSPKSDSPITDLITGTGTVLALELDLVEGKLYWIDSTSGEIKRSDPDGSSPEVVASGFTTSTELHLTLDTRPGKRMVYYSEKFPTAVTKIGKTTMAPGGTPSTFLTLSGDSVGAEVRGMSFDPVTGKLYWTNRTDNYIKRANVDGAVVVEDVTPVGLGAISYRGIDVDVGGRKYYFVVQEDAGGDLIGSASLDGTGDTTLASTGLDNPVDIAVDEALGHVYWTDFSDEDIERINLDGSGRIVFKSGVGAPLAIEVYNPEPATMAILGVGLVGLVLRRRRTKCPPLRLRRTRRRFDGGLSAED